MELLCILFFFCAVSCIGAAVTPFDSSVQIRNAPGHTVEETLRAIRRGLAVASLDRRDDYKAEIPLKRSWSGATLLSVSLSGGIPQNNDNATMKVTGGLDIICTTCYVKGHASAELKINGDFNASQMIEDTRDSISDSVGNLTQQFENYIDNYTTHVHSELRDGFDFKDFSYPLPTIDLKFDLNVTSIPDTDLQITFDDLELYVELNTVLSAGATYEIKLFTSQSLAGIKVGNLLLGTVVTIDLILAAEGAIDISSGFHIKLDDGVELNLALFGDKVSNMNINGGQFEFLPVTLESADVAISAVLRVGAHCGLSVQTPEPHWAAETFSALTDIDWPLPSVRAGIEAAVFANVAEFITRVTYVPEDEECELKVNQEYNMAIGAIAGASVEVEHHNQNKTWGPVIGTSVAIFTTTLDEICARGATTTASEASITYAPERRQDLSEIEITTTITYSGISCKVAGLLNCPNSQQVSISTEFETSMTVSVPTGVSATWPTTTDTTIKSLIPFGSEVKNIIAMSGSPKAYVEDINHDIGDDIENSLEGEIGGVSKKLIVGVSVGVGVPVIAILIGALCCLRRRKRRAAMRPTASPMVGGSYADQSEYRDGSKQAGVDVSGIRH